MPDREQGAWTETKREHGPGCLPPSFSTSVASPLFLTALSPVLGPRRASCTFARGRWGFRHPLFLLPYLSQPRVAWASVAHGHTYFFNQTKPKTKAKLSIVSWTGNAEWPV